MTLEETKTVVAILESAAKIVALGVGGAWTYMLFIRKRQQYPRAQLTHECVAYRVNQERSLLRVTLNIRNTGDVLLRIESGQVRVQQISPLVTGETLEIEGFAGRDGQFEYAWPELGYLDLPYTSGAGLEVEPGESEAIQFDLFVKTGVQVVQIYTYVKNVSKAGREIGWNCTSVHPLESRAAAAAGRLA